MGGGGGGEKTRIRGIHEMSKLIGIELTITTTTTTTTGSRRHHRVLFLLSPTPSSSSSSVIIKSIRIRSKIRSRIYKLCTEKAEAPED